MSPARAELIRGSFGKVEAKSVIAALLFYQRLFALDPTVRSLFQHDIEQQGAKLMQALKFAVAALDRPGELRPVLESLGRRHVYYGVEERHYESVGTALLDVLAHVLGPDFTPEVRAAWTEVYAFMAETMKRAAANAPLPPSATVP